MNQSTQVAVHTAAAIFAIVAVITLAVLVLRYRKKANGRGRATPAPVAPAAPASGRALALVYAPWCKHCKQLVPVFDEFAKQGYSVRQVDGSQKDDAWFKSNKIYRYPTVCVMTADDTVQEQYPSSAPRTKDRITEFGQSVGIF